MILKQVFIINSDLKMNKNKIEKEILKGYELYFNKINKIKSKLNIGIYSEYMMRMNDIYDEFNNDVCDNEIVYNASSNEMLALIGTIKLFNKCMSKNNIWFDIVFDKRLAQVPVKCMTGIVIEPLDEQMADHYFKHYKLL